MKELLIFVLGAIVGFGCSAAFFLGAMIDRISNPVDNVITRSKKIVTDIKPLKGSIIYPKTDETIAMEDTFARNDREGKETLIGEIEGNDIREV